MSVISIVFTHSIFASTKISLGGGIVNPGQALSIPLTNLHTETEYTIRCNINATGATKMHFDMAGAVFTYQQVPAALNDIRLPRSISLGVKGSVIQGDNTFTVISLIRSEQFGQNAALNLIFTNLDDSVIETG